LEDHNRNYRAKSYNVTCLVDEQVETLYTCPDHCRAHMVLLYTKNVGGTVTVSIEWDRADTSHAHILGGKNLSTGEFIQWSGSYIVLEPGDEITVVADGTDPHVDFFCTVEEHFLGSRPNQA